MVSPTELLPMHAYYVITTRSRLSGKHRELTQYAHIIFITS